MKRQRNRRDKGFALVYMAVFLSFLLIVTGLAVDGGRAYVVKAQLTKAVDGAALSAARNLNSGSPRSEAEKIFRANFPDGYMGTSSVTNPTTDASFFDLTTDATTGVNVVTVRATAVMPTTFMRLANFQQVTVSSSGEAQRRMVDLSLVLDVSGSIGSQWTAIRDAAREFVNAFDEDGDRMSLVLFSNGAAVINQMPSSRGFDKADMIADIPNTLPGGSTNMVEGLYRGWDELRAVPTGQQSGLRVIVLFTDGASNGVSGQYDGATAKSLRTADFPKNFPDPDGMTWDSPAISGLTFTNPHNSAASPSYSRTVGWNSHLPLTQVPLLPLQSFHQHHRSAGIPTAFPLMTNAINVNGQPQSSVRPLTEPDATTGKFPTHVHNVNNAARNLLEQVGHFAREDDTGDHPIRIYAIGMGELVRYMLGMVPETSESMLMRIANDKRSPDFNNTQMEGKYYFAQSGADVGPAFQALQSQIVRLSK